MIRLAIVDDHPVVREGMRQMFSTTSRFEVVGAFGGGWDAIEWCAANGVPDVILSDVRMAPMDGFAMFEELRRRFPEVKVLFLAGLPVKAEEERARKMGAKGYMSKHADTNMLSDALVWIVKGAVDFATDGYTPLKTPFTANELEALGHFAKGRTREEIALLMGCTPDNVKRLASRIREKMDANNITAAVYRAQELGFLRV